MSLEIKTDKIMSTMPIYLWQVHTGLTETIAANWSQVTKSGSNGVVFNKMLHPIPNS